MFTDFSTPFLSIRIQSLSASNTIAMKKPTLLFLSLVIVGTLTARAATLPVAEDSYGYRAKLTSAANKATTLPVDATHRAFLYFDLATDIPSGTQIRYARLRLYLPKVSHAGDGLSLH